MADPALAARLFAIAEGPAFVAEAIRGAQAHGIAVLLPDLQAVAQPDLLGLTRYAAPPPPSRSLPPREWLPTGVTAEAGAIYVDWARFGPEPLTASFYEDDIRRALRLPFNRAFRYRTGLPDLIAQAGAADALAPDGFIFHMSRCGSTLAVRMLAALDDSIVIAEAAPLDTVLQLGRSLPQDEAVAALRAIVGAFGRKRCGRERRYVVKLDCWHTLALPLIRRAFPTVPWVFLFRDPVEVLVSQMHQRGMHMVPQFLPPRFYGIADSDALMDEDYCARVLAAICGAALDRRDGDGDPGDPGAALFLNYRDLPDAVPAALLAHFGLSCSAAERQRMLDVAHHDAKSPHMRFAGDAAAKQNAATPAIRRAAAQHLAAIYGRLDALASGNPRRTA